MLSRTFLVLLLGCVLTTSARVVHAGDTTIVLRAEARVRAATVTLGDVAELRSGDAQSLGTLAGIALGPSPGWGETRQLSRTDIRDALAASAPSRAVQFGGSETVLVRPDARVVEDRDLRNVILEHLASVTSWSAEEIEIRSVGNIRGVEIPHAGVSMRISRKTPPSTSRNVLLPVDVLHDGRQIRTVWATVDFVVRAPVLEAAEKVAYGQALEREHLRVAVAEIRDPRTVYLRDPGEAVGQILRRSLSPGDRLTREHLGSPQLVRSGDTVRLRLERHGIRIVTLARAEQGGVLGQWIRVRNLEFSAAPVKARVTGRGEVRVE